MTLNHSCSSSGCEGGGGCEGVGGYEGGGGCEDGRGCEGGGRCKGVEGWGGEVMSWESPLDLRGYGLGGGG